MQALMKSDAERWKRYGGTGEDRAAVIVVDSRPGAEYRGTVLRGAIMEVQRKTSRSAPTPSRKSMMRRLEQRAPAQGVRRARRLFGA